MSKVGRMFLCAEEDAMKRIGMSNEVPCPGRDRGTNFDFWNEITVGVLR